MKYIDLVGKANEEKTMKVKAKEVGPIHRANIEGQVAVLKGQTIKQKSEVKIAEENVKLAKGFYTENTEAYIAHVRNAKDSLMGQKEKLADLEHTSEDLTSLMNEVFSNKK